MSSDLQMTSNWDGIHAKAALSVIQSCPDNWDEQAYRNLMKLDKDKYSVLGMRRNELLQYYRRCLAGQQLCWKHLGVFVDRKLNRSQQYALAPKKVNSFLSCINRSTATRPREEIILLHLLDHTWNTIFQSWEDVRSFVRCRQTEAVKKKTLKMVRGLEQTERELNLPPCFTWQAQFQIVQVQQMSGLAA